MTINNTNIRRAGPAQGNGSTTVFPFTWKVFSKNDLLATYLSIDNVESTLTQLVDYTVTLNPDQNASPGGSITLLTAPPTGTSLTITSIAADTQTLALTNAGGFYPESINNALDRAVILIQQLAEKLSRSLKVTVSTNGTHVAVSPKAGYALGWDADLGLTNLLMVATGTSLVDMASSVGSSLVGFLQSGSGAVVRSVQSKLRDIVSIKDFGAVGDGVADDTASIQAAHNASANVFYPSGTYLVSSAITVTRSGLVYGSGYATQILTNSTTANIFTVTGNYVEIRDIYFNSNVTKTAGWFVDFTNASTRCKLESFWASSAFGVVRSASTAILNITNGHIYGCNAATGIGIQINAGLAAIITGVVIDAAAQIKSAINITACGDVTITDCNLIHGGDCLLLNPAAGQSVTSVWANNTFFDTSTTGLKISPSGIGAGVYRCLFDQCWFSSHGSDGVAIQTASGGAVNGVTLNGCHIFLNGGDGVAIKNTGALNIRVIGCDIAANTGSGFSAATGVSDFSVLSSRIGATGGLAGNPYGVYLVGGATNNYQIMNNDLRGNTINALFNAASGATCIQENNLGVESVSGAINVTASPFTYTSFSTHETVYIIGGTVSSVVVDGQSTFFQGGNTSVRLGPRKSVVVTYTVAPGMAYTRD